MLRVQCFVLLGSNNQAIFCCCSSDIMCMNVKITMYVHSKEVVCAVLVQDLSFTSYGMIIPLKAKKKKKSSRSHFVQGQEMQTRT